MRLSPMNDQEVKAIVVVVVALVLLYFLEHQGSATVTLTDATTGEPIADQSTAAVITSAETVAAAESAAAAPAPAGSEYAADKTYISASTGAFAGTGAALAASATSEGVAGTFIGLTATAWTVIGAAVAGIVALVFAFLSDAHDDANVIVQKYENPFGQYVISIVKGLNSLLENQTLTSGDAQAAYTAVSQSWTNYRNEMLGIEAKGGDWLIVAKQSLNNLNNEGQGETLSNGKRLGLGMNGDYPDGFMTSWLAWMQTLAQTMPA